MLCSHCSKTVRPIVALDIDGTIADYHGHFLRFAADYFSGDPTGNLLAMSLDPYDGTEDFKEYVCFHLGITLEQFRAAKLAYRQGGMKRTMPILPGAKKLVNTIVREGAELWITTTRPYLSLDTILPDTMEWLRRHGILDYHGMLFDDDKYRVLAERVENERVIAIFDDIPEFVDEAAKHFGWAAILIKGEYNQGVGKFRLATTLEEAPTIIEERMRHWRAKYGD